MLFTNQVFYETPKVGIHKIISFLPRQEDFKEENTILVCKNVNIAQQKSAITPLCSQKTRPRGISMGLMGLGSSHEMTSKHFSIR